MTAVIIGLFSGASLGLCVAPLWMMLQFPTRVFDIFRAGSMRMYAFALTIGAVIGAFPLCVYFPSFAGILVLLLGGGFVGMLAAALAEALEVIPVLFDRLSVTADMRYAALALAIGKALGAYCAGLIGG